MRCQRFFTKGMVRGLITGLITLQSLALGSPAQAFQSRNNRDAAVRDTEENEEQDRRPAPRSSRGRSGSKRVPASVVTGQVLEAENGIQLNAPRTMEMQFGMKFSSNQNMCSNIHATIPFPMAWPEQEIVIQNHQIPDQMLWEFRDLPAGARQLVMRMKSMSPENDLNMIVQVQVIKSFIDAPEDTSQFRIPKNLHSELNWYMGSSPYIDVNNSEIKRTARSLADAQPQDAWTHVRSIYDWVRKNIEYTNGPVRHIKDSLKDKKGDCEEMTAIFVALCRASKIPARCVWIPEHCYPEFYLEDQDGNGHWFPCQVAGEAQFGQMHDYRPILQKGDRFKIPEEKATQRYVATYFKCTQRPTVSGGKNVEIEEIVDLGPLQQELDALRRDAASGGTTPSGTTPGGTPATDVPSANGPAAGSSAGSSATGNSSGDAEEDIFGSE